MSSAAAIRGTAEGAVAGRAYTPEAIVPKPSHWSSSLSARRVLAVDAVGDHELPGFVPALDGRRVDAPVRLFEPARAIARQPIQAAAPDRRGLEPALAGEPEHARAHAAAR